MEYSASSSWSDQQCLVRHTFRGLLAKPSARHATHAHATHATHPAPDTLNVTISSYCSLCSAPGRERHPFSYRDIGPANMRQLLRQSLPAEKQVQ